MRYVCNTFTLAMLDPSFPQGRVEVRRIDLEEVKDLLSGDFTSAVGHQGTAEVLTTLLGIEIPYNRVSIQLKDGDEVVVFQLLVRLEEGRVLNYSELRALYEEGKINFFHVKVYYT